MEEFPSMVFSYLVFGFLLALVVLAGYASDWKSGTSKAPSRILFILFGVALTYSVLLIAAGIFIVVVLLLLFVGGVAAYHWLSKRTVFPVGGCGQRPWVPVYGQ